MEKIKRLFLLMAILIPAIAFTSCGDDEKDEPNVPNQSLNVGQTYTIPADGTWTSDNDLIASVSGKSVKGIRAGETIVRNGGKSFKVKVNPTITLYKDPCLKFGDNKQSVKNFMKSYGYDFDESATNLSYASQQNGAVVGYGYTFENSKLTMSMVMAQRSIASTDRMADYLSQRFVPVTNNGDYIGMVSPDKKTLVLFTLKSMSGNIMYVTAYSPNTSSKGRSSDYEAIFKGLVNATPGKVVPDGTK